jgi:hypothetical protein
VPPTEPGWSQASCTSSSVSLSDPTQTDKRSPGAGPLPDKLTPPLAALVAGVKKAGVAPAKVAGGHGSVGDYTPLAALEGK